MAEEIETQQRRTIAAVSERDGEPGWTTGARRMRSGGMSFSRRSVSGWIVGGTRLRG